MPGDAVPPLSDLSFSGTASLAHIDLDALDSLLLADGEGFPPSYRRFVRTVGWARLFGLWLVYPPVHPGWADGWQARSAFLTARFQEQYADSRQEDFDWVVEPDGSWDLVPSLTVLGWSENGDVLLWDTSVRDSDGELPIYLSRHSDSLELLPGPLENALLRLGELAGPLSDRVPFDVEPLVPVRQ